MYDEYVTKTKNNNFSWNRFSHPFAVLDVEIVAEIMMCLYRSTTIVNRHVNRITKERKIIASVSRTLETKQLRIIMPARTLRRHYYFNPLPSDDQLLKWSKVVNKNSFDCFSCSDLCVQVLEIIFMCFKQSTLLLVQLSFML